MLNDYGIPERKSWRKHVQKFPSQGSEPFDWKACNNTKKHCYEVEPLAAWSSPPQPSGLTGIPESGLAAEKMFHTLRSSSQQPFGPQPSGFIGFRDCRLAALKCSKRCESSDKDSKRTTLYQNPNDLVRAHGLDWGHSMTDPPPLRERRRHPSASPFYNQHFPLATFFPRNAAMCINHFTFW